MNVNELLPIKHQIISRSDTMKENMEEAKIISTFKWNMCRVSHISLTETI